jgi:hypothetical protein
MLTTLQHPGLCYNSDEGANHVWRCRHIECVTALLAHRARYDLVDTLGWSPRDHALYRGHMEIAQLLQRLHGM